MIDKLARSFRFMALIAAAGLMLALSSMVVVSARSLERFEPVHRHAAKLQQLRWVEGQLMRVVLAGAATETTPSETERLVAARKGLEALLTEGGYLAPATEEQLGDVASSLSADDPEVEHSTIEAVRGIEDVLASEMRAHDELLTRVESDTQWELGLSAALTLGLPFASGLLLFALRRRILVPLEHLRNLMDLLVPAFVAEFNLIADKKVTSVRASTWERLEAHDWPGNVRELRNAVERCVLFSTNETFPDEWLQLRASRPEAEPAVVQGDRISLPLDGSMPLEAMDRHIIQTALERHDYNVTATARSLGTTRETLRYRIQKYGLTRASVGSLASNGKEPA